MTKATNTLYLQLDELDLYELHSAHWKRFFWYRRRDKALGLEYRRRAMAIDKVLKSRGLDPKAKTLDKGAEYTARQGMLAQAQADGATMAEMQELLATA